MRKYSTSQARAVKDHNGNKAQPRVSFMGEPASQTCTEFRGPIMAKLVLHRIKITRRSSATSANRGQGLSLVVGHKMRRDVGDFYRRHHFFKCELTRMLLSIMLLAAATVYDFSDEGSCLDIVVLCRVAELHEYHTTNKVLRKYANVTRLKYMVHLVLW